MTASSSPDDAPDLPAASCVTLATPDGPFTVIASSDAVLASGWTDDIDLLLSLVHPPLRPVRNQLRMLTEDGIDQGDTAESGDASPSGSVLAQAVWAVRDYYGGDLSAPARVPVHQVSGPFRAQAWEVLRGVAPGEPVTYAVYAERCSRPTAVRAAAGACAFNAAALFVPCHRVLRSDGTLGGFRYGVDVKRRLLDREARAAVG